MTDQPYLERVAASYQPADPEPDFNPAFAVYTSTDELVQRQKAGAANRPLVNRDRVPRVRGAGGSPIVDAAIRTLQRSTLTNAQRDRLRSLVA